MSYFIRKLFLPLISLATLGFLTLGCLLFYLSLHLPNVDSLKDVKLQVPLRIYSADRKLIAEYGDKRRIPITFKDIPPQLVHALLATEDQRFYEHPGVDVWGLMRAFVQLVKTGSKSQGGSTITMQVARNFFLSRKKTYIRKLNEILLAIKIDHELSKEKILELYFNKIYLGNRAYGVAAAANVYYGKPLSQLNLAQLAMLAGLPKAPSNLNPIINPTAAQKRREHVLSRMLEQHYITQQEYDDSVLQPLTASFHGRKIALHAPYVAEMVRQALVSQLGNKAYTQGYQVTTTVNSQLQIDAQHAVQQAVLAYDHRHGFKGPVQLKNSTATLASLPYEDNLQPLRINAIDAQSQNITGVFRDGTNVTVDFKTLTWLRPGLRRHPIHAGDIVYALQLTPNHWVLAQYPTVQGALVSLDPNNGNIKALVGGFNFKTSSFNRITQASRQPGSCFKPFIYSAALAKGFTLATMINDAPVVKDDPSQQALWRPQNDTRQFYGPTRLRVGLINSRNLVSIRLLEAIGINYARQYLARFGFNPNGLPNTLSLALGAVDVTPLQLANGYAVFANGGYSVHAHIISRITDSDNTVIMQDDSQDATKTQAISSPIAYLMTQALRDVILHGTGRRARSLNRFDLAGKTGTTNDQKDAWFAGFNSQLVAITWMGFDTPKSLKEYGAQAALPMWMAFMAPALKNQPESTLVQPPNIISVRIDPKTGLLANDGRSSVFEYFRSANAPKQLSPPANTTDDSQIF